MNRRTLFIGGAAALTASAAVASLLLPRKLPPALTYTRDGFAIGGSVGKDTDEVASLLSYLVPLLPPDRPRHLLGVGDEKTVLASTREGVDTFDSTLPSKNARHGQLMTRTRGTFNVARAECARMHEPPCRECGCALCVNLSLIHISEPTRPY